MATASTVIHSAANVRQPDPLRICFKEAKYEFLKSLRNPMYSVSTLLFPIMFYILFGLVMGKQMIGGIRTTVYLIPSYGTFGVMGASLFGTAAGLASERGLGWLQVKRASPMPPFAYFLAKVVMSLIFSAWTLATSLGRPRRPQSSTFFTCPCHFVRDCGCRSCSCPSLFSRLR